MVNVIVYRGKHESIDTFMLKQFDNIDAANEFINECDDRERKYYTCANIIDLNTEYEIHGNSYGDGAYIERSIDNAI